MSVAGIDFGNLSLLIAQTAKGGVDVILNDSSNRQTATAISVQGKQRFIGDSGAAMARTNLLNTVQGMKLLVGRQFDDPDVQREMARHPFKTVKMEHGGVGIEVTYNDEPIVVSAEHFMAMMLVKAKDISAQANAGLNLADSVLAVPHWFSQSQRRGVLQACEIAQLNCLKVSNESTSIALSYGIFKSAKKLFSETEPTHVMFVDIGLTGYCVTVVDFIQERMAVRSTVCERALGGRDFDDIIIEFLAETFQKKFNIDVRRNRKALLKLQAAAEKAKKTLSPAGVSEASVSVECVAEDRDLNVVLTKDEFEARAAPLVARLAAPLERALREAGLTAAQLSEVEVVGGSTRINIVKKTLGALLGLDASAVNYGLKTTMNADEAVARGGALQCAMLSSRMKVKPFTIVDTLAHSVDAVFDGADGQEQRVPLFVRGDEVPHKPRRVTFRNKSADFSVAVQYGAVSELPEGESRNIARFTVRLPAEEVQGGADVRVNFALDKSGLVFLQSAQLMLEMSDEEAAEAARQEAEAAEKKGDEKKADEAEAGKKRFRKVDLRVEAAEGGLSRAQLNKALETEAQMSLEDRLIQETADKRNELEAYLYAMRDRLEGNLKAFSTKDERAKLSAMMAAAEEWLYGDGFEVSKAEYAKKIESLRAVGDLIETRCSQHEKRPAAVDALKRQLELCKQFAANYSADYEHITDEERGRVRAEVTATEAWLYDMLSKQEERGRDKDVLLTLDMIAAKRTALFNATNPIMIKPKPKPAPKKEDEAKQESKQDAKQDAKPEDKQEKDSSVPMDETP